MLYEAIHGPHGQGDSVVWCWLVRGNHGSSAGKFGKGLKAQDCPADADNLAELAVVCCSQGRDQHRALIHSR